MEDLISPLHAFTGIFVFILGCIQFIRRKGGRVHRVLGQMYVYSWFVLIATGAYLGGLLITIIGIFGLYFTLTGARLAMVKNKGVAMLDKMIISTGGLVMTAMVFYAVWLFVKGNIAFAIIFAVFGVLFFLTIQQDVRKYILKTLAPREKYGRMDWYFEHLNRMSISFIACITAFTSIQDVFGHDTLNFLLPTAIGFAGIYLLHRQHEKSVLREKSQ